MRIRLRDVHEEATVLQFEEPTTEINPLFEQGPVHDFEFQAPVFVELECYRAGQDVFFAGEARDEVVGQCARCLETFSFPLVAPIALVFVPRPSRPSDPSEADDVYVYDGEELDLSPALRERILLSLPTLPLCREDCRGLCPNCGKNLNQGDCDCPESDGDPRLAVLRGLKIAR
jgi:DUF177 domain-containing protein